MWTDDISFCPVNKCKMKSCPRNPINIRDKSVPHSYFVGLPTDCPKKAKLEPPVVKDQLEPVPLPDGFMVVDIDKNEAVRALKAMNKNTITLYKMVKELQKQVKELKGGGADVDGG